MSRVRAYRDNRDWWIGVYRDTEKRRIYICLLPNLVIRWQRKETA
jgi:hypothetical protein